ncbi:MAG: HlyD family efflux transporter periplasmic adaptor subunit [Bacteroidota bacterium]
MLNISTNSIPEKQQIEDKYSAFQVTQLSRANRMLTIWISTTLFIAFLLLLMPWTQNIQMKGKVTTLLPEQRPQTVNSAIAGRIEKWYVREGDLVAAGDTIVFLSEVKAEYFDPQLVERTANQVQAKQAAINNYEQKAQALSDQINALQQELTLKKQQAERKIKQARLKQESNVATVEQAQADYDVAEYQLRRTDTLYQKGIKSLIELEGKRLKVQEARAKLISAKNKLQESENEVRITNLQLNNIDNEYANKIAKTASDRFSTLSTRYDAEGSLNKLQNQYENYSLRNNMYYVTAPQAGYITEAIKEGVGEILKEGDQVVTIVPKVYDLAVELYVRPMDLPLMQRGQEVRFIFDGWPAFIFSGWPDVSFGTYSGEITAIDNIPYKNSNYRILVAEDDAEKPWPELLRVGSGAEGIALLNTVPAWYELWRQLNGFPADFYEDDEMDKKDDTFKPPVKAVVK